jgi:signal transduction histidine kinase/ActR/RegA family two-component response regulator
VLIALVFAALTGFALTKRIVSDQDQRLLSERGDEVVALLSNSIGSIDSSLRVLGAVASSSKASASSVFTASAQTLVKGNVQTVGVAARRDGAFRVVAVAGDGPAPGTALEEHRAILADRALAEGQLVSTLLSEKGGTRFVLAVPTAELVVFEESMVDPTTPVPSTPQSPFRDLRVVLYASPRPEPSRLLVTTEPHLPLSGRVVHKTFKAGADTWSLDVAAIEPLSGSLAHNAPWILLAGGLLAAALATAVTEILARRRAYALALVVERTADMRRAQEAAEGANRSKSEFLSRMSHELRTPLNAVLGFGQMLELDDLNDDQRESVAHIIKGGKHLLELINEVLDIARIETGDLALSPEAVRVGQLLEDSLALIRPIAEQGRIQVVVDRSGGWESHVFADRQRVIQVLLNLLSNAVKYNRQHGTVAVSAAPNDEGRIRISVTDTGPGIRPEHLELLFRPFERLGAEQSDVEGIGIGLALSQRLAEAMGGTLGVESSPGQGSTFWVELPGVEDPVSRYERLDTPPSEREAEAPTAPRRTVLYIEDNLSNLKLVERILSRRPGVELVPAMQGRLGLELAREHRPFLILLDLHLPDMGGDQVLQRLRDDPVSASTPVVMVSADASPGQVQRLLAAGAAGYLTKPIDVRELIRVIDEALDGQ